MKKRFSFMALLMSVISFTVPFNTARDRSFSESWISKRSPLYLTSIRHAPSPGEYSALTLIKGCS